MGTIAMVRVEALGDGPKDAVPRRSGRYEDRSASRVEHGERGGGREAGIGGDGSPSGAGNDDGRAADLAELALDAIDHVDESASLYKPDSVLNRINARAFGEAVLAGPLMTDLLAESLRIARLTRGAFDPTIKPVMDHLGFYRELGSRPDPGGLSGALDRVGWKRIDFDEKTGSVRFRKPGMALDLGGVGKGYALDRAADVLIRGGVTRGLVTLGRSYRVLGRGSEAGGLFALDVAAPDPDGEERVRAVIFVPSGSVATSSPMAQTREWDGRLVGHIVDPRRGPLVTRVLSATVWAPTGSVADAIAKAIVVSGPRALERLARRTRFEALLIVSGPEGRAPKRHRSLVQGNSDVPREASPTSFHILTTPGLKWKKIDPHDG